jgi:hypothetical protein
VKERVGGGGKPALAGAVGSNEVDLGLMVRVAREEHALAVRRPRCVVLVATAHSRSRACTHPCGKDDKQSGKHRAEENRGEFHRRYPAP